MSKIVEQLKKFWFSLSVKNFEHNEYHEYHLNIMFLLQFSFSFINKLPLYIINS